MENVKQFLFQFWGKILNNVFLILLSPSVIYFGNIKVSLAKSVSLHIPDICHFFTLTHFESWKFYTRKVRKFTTNGAQSSNFLFFSGIFLHSAKKFTFTALPALLTNIRYDKHSALLWFQTSSGKIFNPPLIVPTTKDYADGFSNPFLSLRDRTTQY